MNRTLNKMTLVCYDITNEKLRRKIDKCMKDFGSRLQFSIFLCRLNPEGVARCRKKLQDVITRYKKHVTSSDSIIIFEQLNQSAADCLIGARIEGENVMFKIY